MFISSSLLLIIMSLFTKAYSSPIINESSVVVQQHDATWSWSSCNAPGDLTHINSLAISPDPPRAGNTELIRVSGYSDGTLNNGAWAQLTLGIDGYRPFALPERIDICSAFNNVRCPINKGPFDIQGSLKIPEGLSGTFDAKVDVYNADSSHIACVSVKAVF